MFLFAIQYLGKTKNIRNSFLKWQNKHWKLVWPYESFYVWSQIAFSLNIESQKKNTKKHIFTSWIIWICVFNWVFLFELRNKFILTLWNPLCVFSNCFLCGITKQTQRKHIFTLWTIWMCVFNWFFPKIMNHFNLSFKLLFLWILNHEKSLNLLWLQEPKKLKPFFQKFDWQGLSMS